VKIAAITTHHCGPVPRRSEGRVIHRLELR
jgi:hypothetical protein